MQRIEVGTAPLTEADVVAVARGGAGVELSPKALALITDSRAIALFGNSTTIWVSFSSRLTRMATCDGIRPSW